MRFKNNLLRPNPGASTGFARNDLVNIRKTSLRIASVPNWTARHLPNKRLPCNGYKSPFGVKNMCVTKLNSNCWYIIRCKLHVRLWQDRQYTYNTTFRRIHVTIVVVESSKYYIFWVCVCSPNRSTSKAMRLTILSNAACVALPYFYTLSHKRHYFCTKHWKQKCFVVWNISHSKKNSAMYYHKYILVF
jgi:hypothetical protein